MGYHLEELGAERFQWLCQALLATSFPNLQCLPTRRPDGGRDAFVRTRGRGGKPQLTIFQVKYVEQPNTRSPEEQLKKVIRSELSKIRKLIERGAKKYYLLTNLIGSSHLDSGSVDKLNTYLSEQLSIQTTCWWREDIERRIDDSPNIKWSYPEILKGTDLLQALLQAQDSASGRRIDAIRAYMGIQSQHDQKLKFKQIELQADILKLFVDVPAALPSLSDEENRKNDELIRRVISSLEPSKKAARAMKKDEDAVGAHVLLIDRQFVHDYSQVIVEGAPGQGKSTVTQYLCQTHRLKLLGRPEFLSIMECNRPRIARIPFRVDLRDYASWLGGFNSFDQSQPRPEGSTAVLESFIACQVHHLTGATFTVDDLWAVGKSSQLLIVLDGFDEVADIDLRNRIVVEVSEAAVRLREISLSVQIIVTSRPSAFANSPGFALPDWKHVQLVALSREVIDEYASKWIHARGFETREAEAIRQVLSDKLGQSHVSDLAQNPMQLAILLALISVRGASLPDKRTALYDAYMDIFLNRESEKSYVIRDHRPLLLKIHGHIAWSLHAEAELTGSAGNISQSQLQELVRSFLAQEGHSVELAEKLFVGIVDRVVVLVSRVQGTYEFEVQPLREYFCARHLHDTAPYCPVGSKRSGTLPERFSAICRNFYWLNVARFYAGCYSSGELASLVDGLEEVGTSDEFNSIGHVWRLGLTLVGDHVFAMHPRLERRVVLDACARPNLILLLANRIRTTSTGYFSLPSGPAKDALLACLINAVESDCRHDVLFSVGGMIALNTSSSESIELWWEMRKCLKHSSWLSIGLAMEVYTALEPGELHSIVADDDVALQYALLSGRVDLLSQHSIRQRAIAKQIRSPSMYRWRGIELEDEELLLIQRISGVSSLLLSSLDDPERPPLGVLLSHYGFIEREWADKPKTLTSVQGQIASALKALLEVTIAEASGNLAGWDRLLTLCVKCWGRSWLTDRLAISAAELIASDITYVPLNNSGTGLLGEALAANDHKQDNLWWKDRLLGCDSDGGRETLFVLQCMAVWAAGSTILACSSELTPLLSRLPIEDWSGLLHHHRDSGDLAPVAADDVPEFYGLHPRMIVLLAQARNYSFSDAVYENTLSTYDGDDWFVWNWIASNALSCAACARWPWSHALGIVARAYEHGVCPDTSFLIAQAQHGHHAIQMPEEDARNVCKDPTRFPLSLVAEAEIVLASAVGRNASPVKLIADRECWFASGEST